MRLASGTVTSTATSAEKSVEGNDVFNSQSAHSGGLCKEATSQPVVLRTFGLFGGTTVPSILQKKFQGDASFCVVPLTESSVADDGKQTGTTYTSLHTLMYGVGGDGEGPEEAWELLSRTSSWAPFTCGRVVASSWNTPAGEKNSVPDQLRLAAFLGLSAVLVPLPALEDDGNDGEAVFTRAVTVLAEHMRQAPMMKIWVHCDASRQEHRVAFSRLRMALMWGNSLPSLREAADSVTRGMAHRVAPYLYFSETFNVLLSEWLGEPVVGFEPPKLDTIRRALCPNFFNGDHSLELPCDIIPFLHSYWGTAHPVFMSLGAFMVELLRRRAMPVFCVDDFGETYPILNWLYETCVSDNGRDTFAEFEDVLQLPLQPLGHMLSSGTYEVFERDTTKYTKYYDAMVSYFREWLAHYEDRSHGRMWGQSRCGGAGGGGGGGGEGKMSGVLYVVLLGSGRGPLVGECLAAACSVGVCVHLFAVEKNPEAMGTLRLRLCADPQWRYWIETYGHVVETVLTDGRAATQMNDPLPKEWGLCDLVLSELLGSFGDNELSPECLDDFYKDLQRYQVSNGIPSNPHLTSIPQQYTAWIAPLHSGWMEEAIAQHAVSGLTVLPPWCDDRRAALFHSMFVSNVSRGVALSLPQPCWTFRHFTSKEEPKEREVILDFRVGSGGRCSGFIGYFSALLFSPTVTSCAGGAEYPAVSMTMISIAPHERTPNMFSWFPCVFAVEPRDVMEVQAGDLLRLRMRRCVSTSEGGRVWYDYDAVLLQHPGEIVKGKTATINESGWAASILLSS